MKKKIAALLMAAAMTAGLISGCGSSTDTSASTAASASEADAGGGTESEPADEGEPYEITMQVVTWGQTPEELEQVESAINDIILPEINATVSLQPVAAWDIVNESQMALTSGEKWIW